MAADGSQPKYAQACLLAVHAIRFTHKSPMPIEVMYVGVAESFSPSAAGHLTSYGHVTLIDLLTRLAPELRVDASTILRSFAVKPFAMLASSFDEVLLMDANVVLFTPPESLFTLQSYLATGTQLFQDYLRAFRTLDPWIVHSYVAAGGYTKAGSGVHTETVAVYTKAGGIHTKSSGVHTEPDAVHTGIDAVHIEADTVHTNTGGASAGFHAASPGSGTSCSPGGGGGGGGVSPLDWYEAVTCGAEIDSSVVVLDKRRAWRLLHAVCGLNWYRHVIYRHMWGDKDTWALGALMLASADATKESSPSSAGGQAIPVGAPARAVEGPAIQAGGPSEAESPAVPVGGPAAVPVGGASDSAGQAMPVGGPTMLGGGQAIPVQGPTVSVGGPTVSVGGQTIPTDLPTLDSAPSANLSHNAEQALAAANPVTADPMRHSPKHRDAQRRALSGPRAGRGGGPQGRNDFQSAFGAQPIPADAVHGSPASKHADPSFGTAKSITADPLQRSPATQHATSPHLFLPHTECSRPPAGANPTTADPIPGCPSGGVNTITADLTRRCPATGAAAFASVYGSHVGWFLNQEAEPPSALWGHVQFARGRGVAAQAGGVGGVRGVGGAGIGGGASRACGRADLGTGAAMAGAANVDATARRDGSGNDPSMDASMDASRDVVDASLDTSGDTSTDASKDASKDTSRGTSKDAVDASMDTSHDTSRDAKDASHETSRLLYLNWQPHYTEVRLAPWTGCAALPSFLSRSPPHSQPPLTSTLRPIMAMHNYTEGYFDLGPTSLPGAAGASLDCCVMLNDLWEGPHDTPTQTPRALSPAYTRAVRATLNDTRAEMFRLDMSLPRPPRLKQPRFRRCTIYWGIFLGAVWMLLARVAALARLGRAQRAAAGAKLHVGHGLDRQGCCAW